LVPGRPGVLRQLLRWHWARRARRRQVRRGTGRWDAQLDIRPPNLPHRARRVGARIVRLPGGDPNAPAAVARVGDLDIDVLVNVGSLARLRRTLLDQVGTAVNLHDGAMPRQRGIGVGAWAILTGAPTVAATFHRMTAGIDEGPILLEVPVPVLATDVAADLAYRTALAARRLLPALVDALAADDPGRAQVGIACIHDLTSRRLAGRVDDPTALTAAEWDSRLRALASVALAVDGRDLAVTAVETCLQPADPGVSAHRCGCGLPGWTGVDGRALHVVAAGFRLVRAQF